jgi:uncharacterized membrane protein
MKIRNKKLKVALVVLLLTGSQAAFAVNWVCHATIDMVGTSKTWTPQTWRMSSGAWFVDREKRCREYIEKEFLNESIFNRAPFYTEHKSEQIAYCKNGATFRVTYGHSKRKKGWNFTKQVKAKCRQICTNEGY